MTYFAQNLTPFSVDGPTFESEALPAFCRKDCESYSDGWCPADRRNAFVSVDVMDRCPLDPQRIGKPRYRIVTDTDAPRPIGFSDPIPEPSEAPQTNQEVFNCYLCGSYDVKDGKDVCTYDPRFHRFIDWWGYCPFQPDLPGAVEGWKGAITPKYCASVFEREGGE